MRRVKIATGEIDPLQPLVDIFGGPAQVFQTRPDSSLLNFLSNPINQAEFLIIPHDCKFWTHEYFNYVKQISKSVHVLYFNRADVKRRIRLNNATSIQITKGLSDKDKVIVIPCNVRSLSHLPFRDFNPNPSVSFVGFIPSQSPRRIINSLRESWQHPIRSNGAIIRAVTTRKLRESSLNSTILVRSHYGGAASLISDPKTFRQEFENSINRSDFVLCPRGDANGSQRYYEALSAGRIPIVPKSNILLPKINELQKEFNSLEIKTLGFNLEAEVLKLWHQLNPTKYSDIQSKLRTLFETHYSYESYLKYLFTQESVDALLNLRI